MKRVTMKFGGTSLGSVDVISQAAEIVNREAEVWDQIVIVVSAMNGVTDALLLAARPGQVADDSAVQSVREDLWALHVGVIDQLVTYPARREALLADLERLLNIFSQTCQELAQHEEPNGRLLDIVASIGERCSARVLAAVLQDRGLESKSIDAMGLILTDDRFQNAVPNLPLTRKQVEAVLIPYLEGGGVPVVTGFIGSTPDGELTTLGRGGSDYSAAIIGACVDADELWIWTDVDGVLTADPGIVPHARIIDQLSHLEVSELAYFGAQVVHPKTIQPLAERNIPIRVRNTFSPENPGTCILRGPGDQNGLVKAVTVIQDLSMITVEGRGMIGVPGIAARTFSAVASEGVSVMMISQASSEQSISFVVPNESAGVVVSAVEGAMSAELERRDIDRVWSLDDVVIVTTVGAGLRETPGIAARIFGALGDGRINVIAIAQGSSECGLSLVVRKPDALDAVRRIHDEVVLHD